MKSLTPFEREVTRILGLDKSKVSSLPEDQMRQLYTTAYELYEKGDYRTSGQLFTRLVLSAPFSEDFWLGLASAKQMTCDYEASLHAWALVSLLNESDPLPHLHAAECLLSLDQKAEALKALDLALERAGANSALCEKIQLLKTIHYVEN